ncbi:MAG: MBL fold metallo-hydrolase [Deltaproteobacteria bacterium]|nr:MAG: MBL fold metallo-hydrolase [Deltaproteobacteria bacterium]
MAIALRVLGSGSGGNSSILRLETPDQHLHYLFDAGFSPRELRKRLHIAGLVLEQIDGLFITHLHRDHFKDGWQEICWEHNIPIYLNTLHVRLWKDFGRSMEGVTVLDEDYTLTNDTHLSMVRLPHDQQGSVGFVVEHRGTRLGFATDLGHVPKSLFQAFRRLDGLALECNYDPDLQRNSRRPAYLKRRIMGSYGHLSNPQSLKAIRKIAEHSSLQHIILLHRSEQCNSIPHIEYLASDLCPHLSNTLRFTDQSEPTGWFEVQPPNANTHPVTLKPDDQMELFSL